MNKNLKKILVAGASLLMLASVGVSASQITKPVSANRVSRLLAKRRKDYRNAKGNRHDIAKINAELNRLKHRARNKAKKNATKHAHYAKYSGKWFKQNAQRIFRAEYNKLDSYTNGADDGMYSQLNLTQKINSFYHEGWVISNANQNSNIVDHYITPGEYAHSNYLFNKGIRYVHHHKHYKHFKVTFHGRWYINRQ